MAEPIAALIVRILTDTTEMVSGVKKASDQLDGFENNVVDVDQALKSIANASGQASGSVGTLTGTYRQFDGVLQAVGINIGPQVKGLEDIAGAAGKSVGSVGALGTAGLMLGAGMAGWGVGRAIADFFDLDDAIAQATASLMGFGDMAAETAGAKMDTINRAIAAGAAETISYAKAIEFLVTAERQKADAYAVSALRLANAQKEMRGLSEATIHAIGVAQQAGATQEEISRHFGVSADALRALAEQQREASRAAAEHKKEVEALNKSYEKLISDTKNANQLAIFDKDADTQRRREENDRQMALMNRDAGLISNRNEFDDREERIGSVWERRYFEEQARLDREFQQLMQQSARPSAPASASAFGGNPGGFASVMNPTSITIQANNSFFNSPSALNELARLVEDAIARRSGLSNTYTRR